MLLTISGSSCSGKTTAARACADLPGLVVHDFDEIGVPVDADGEWRQRSMEDWARRALDYQESGLDLLLTGQSPLGEVLACPSAVDLDGIAACLLDVADDERLRRLERRDPGKWPPDRARSFVGWARWHRGHAADPRHLPEAITIGGWSAMRWHRWTGWSSGDPRWIVTVIDTTGKTVDRSTADLRDWIAAARAGRSSLPSDWAAGPGA
ncbi:hypothetical protein AB0J74_11110 [Asanoa sp. NPDC049573]|uniref:hypothetical protein n=1 Tax=Asanoa sp. NPDC049573 TaxID=3155396 RepID=UPI003413BB08